MQRATRSLNSTRLGKSVSASRRSVTSRAIADRPTIASIASRMSETVIAMHADAPPALASSISIVSVLSPPRMSAITPLNNCGSVGWMMLITGRPMAARAGVPNSRSAPPFQVSINPVALTEKTASPEQAITALSRSALLRAASSSRS